MFLFFPTKFPLLSVLIPLFFFEEMNPMSKRMKQMAAAASLAACLVLPGIAQADVCRKIDYKFATKVYDQVVTYTSNIKVNARDAACILRNVTFSNEQERIGVYLATRLRDPENINWMLKEVKMQVVRDKIIEAARDNQNQDDNTPPPPPPPSGGGFFGAFHRAPPPPPPEPSIRIVRNINKKVDYTFAAKIKEQLELYIGDAYIYCKDAGAILKKIKFAAVQEEIGIYLTDHLADPENIDVMLKSVSMTLVREKIAEAARQRMASRPPPPPPPPPPHMMPPPPPPPPPTVHNVHMKVDYSLPGRIMGQLKTYIGNSYIYASDAAAILRKIDIPKYQQEAGAYLCPKIIDRDNLDVFLNAVEIPNVRNAIVNACSD